MLIVGVAPSDEARPVRQPSPSRTSTCRPAAADVDAHVRLCARGRAAERRRHGRRPCASSCAPSMPNLPVMLRRRASGRSTKAARRCGSCAPAARLFLTLGLAAAFVAVVGLYGVRSYLVSRRTREFGVRMAVGASPADVLRLVLREALDHDHGRTRDRTGPGRAAGLGIERGDLPGQPVRSDHAWRRRGNSGRRIVRRVGGPGATRRERVADDGAAQRLESKVPGFAGIACDSRANRWNTDLEL